jgi:hypothetical protein
MSGCRISSCGRVRSLRNGTGPTWGISVVSPDLRDPSADHTECIAPGLGAYHLLAVSWGIGILSANLPELDLAAQNDGD